MSYQLKQKLFALSYMYLSDMLFLFEIHRTIYFLWVANDRVGKVYSGKCPGGKGGWEMSGLELPRWQSA